MLKELKRQVYEANMLLVEYKLVILTWGNVSAIDRPSGLVVIKPSGVEYSRLKPEDMVVVDLDGNQVEGRLKPSSDTPTHIALYRAFGSIGGITHTHSPYAVAFAQAGRGIPSYGTTHADYFDGEIPCTREMSGEEIKSDYEYHTGAVIAELFSETGESGKPDPARVPAALVHSHGPFTWGRDAAHSAENAFVLENTAMMAFQTELLGGNTPMREALLRKHFDRKHGPGAYYGQK